MIEFIYLIIFLLVFQFAEVIILWINDVDFYVAFESGVLFFMLPFVAFALLFICLFLGIVQIPINNKKDPK